MREIIFKRAEKREFIRRLHDEASSTSWLDELASRALHDEVSFVNTS